LSGNFVVMPCFFGSGNWHRPSTSHTWFAGGGSFWSLRRGIADTPSSKRWICSRPPWENEPASSHSRPGRQRTRSVSIGYRYRADSGKSREGKPRKAWSGNEDGLLARMQEIIRLRHYAKSTEKACPHWVRRSLAYRKDSGLGVSRLQRTSRRFLPVWQWVRRRALRHRIRRSVHCFFFSGRFCARTGKKWLRRFEPSEGGGFLRYCLSARFRRCSKLWSSITS